MRGKKPMNLAGQRFGRLIAVSRGSDGRWLCRCDCGQSVARLVNKLRTGETRSCGCLRREVTAAKNVASTTHGDSHSAEYMAWACMQKRCYNPKFRGFKYYGERGVKVADVWMGRGGYERFLEHVGRKPTAKHSLDRIDTYGDYTPGNVRWATASEQMRNRRPWERKPMPLAIPPSEEAS